MCSSQQPTNGADSEDYGVAPADSQKVGNDPIPDEPPLIGKPMPTRDQILTAILQILPVGTPREVLMHEVAQTEMADRLGRAIHAAKIIGGPWGPPCMRLKPGTDPSGGLGIGEEDFEPVPYGYEGLEYECLCESMSMHLIQLMKANAEQPMTTDSVVRVTS